MSDASRQFLIRFAVAGDQPVLAGLEVILKSRREPDFVDRVFELTACGARTLFLGFYDDLPAGYVIINWAPSYNLFDRLRIPEIQDLNVLPDFRCRGLGQKLVEACEKHARERGAQTLGLGVGLTSDYGAAQRLYARMGYLPDGYGLTYDRKPVSAGEFRPVDDSLCLMMAKEL